jgi:hypothetical protein
MKSTKEHLTQAINWLGTRIADEIATGFKGVTARRQTPKIQDTSQTSTNATMKRQINKRESPPCPIDKVEID